MSKTPRSYVGYTDEIHAKLDSIEHALVELGEELLLNECTEAEYAFAVHDALHALPLLLFPTHFRVMKRITQWHDLNLITKEMKTDLLRRVAWNSRASDAGSASTASLPPSQTDDATPSSQTIPLTTTPAPSGWFYVAAIGSEATRQWKSN